MQEMREASLPRSSKSDPTSTANMTNTAIPLDVPAASVGVPTLQDMSISSSDFGVEIPF